LVEAAAAVRVGATQGGQRRDGILEEFPIAGAAGGTSIIGDDQADPADSFIRLKLPQGDGGRRVQPQIRAAFDAFRLRVGRLRKTQRAVSQWELLLDHRILTAAQGMVNRSRHHMEPISRSSRHLLADRKRNSRP